MYKERLEDHIKYIIKDLKPLTYDDIFRRSKGAFPDIVFDIAKENITLPLGSIEESSNINADRLPAPNPSNFDWRFDSNTVEQLKKKIQVLKSKKVALFGTPSLFDSLSEVADKIILFDINELLPQAFNFDSRIVNCDINDLDISKYGKFDCVVMDPPWYLDFYKNWIQKANEMLEEGGFLISSLFQEFLRPNATFELFQISQIASECGDIEIQEDFVYYDTPKFEKEIFLEKHIPVKGNWRVADLLVIRNKRKTYFPITQVQQASWTQIAINNKVVAIKIDEQDVHITSKMAHEEGALLLTVSDRDPVKKKVNLITSNNYGLIITGNRKVIEFLKQLANGSDYKMLVDEMKINKDEEEHLDTILKIIDK